MSCNAKTKAGTKCKRITTNGKKCYQHRKRQQYGGGSVSYVVSAHGEIVEGAEFTVPDNVTLYTYEHLGQVLHVDKVVQTDICLRATQGFQGFNSRKPTLSFAQGRKFPDHILVKDADKNFYSGVIRCRPKPEKNEIFINIDREPNDILLSDVVKRIKDRHPDEEIYIHLLHCHSNDDIDSVDDALSYELAAMGLS